MKVSVTWNAEKLGLKNWVLMNKDIKRENIKSNHVKQILIISKNIFKVKLTHFSTTVCFPKYSLGYLWYKNKQNLDLKTKWN